MSLRKLLELDAQVSAQARVAEHPGRLRTLARVLAHTGDSWFWLAGLALTLLMPSWRGQATTFMFGIVLTALVVMTIKFTVRRGRPAGEWGGIYRKSDPHSFPSGHAARGAMLSVVAFGMGPFWLAGLILLWAPLMAMARVVMGLHYLSDVVAGMVLGAVLGFMILQLNFPWS